MAPVSSTMPNISARSTALAPRGGISKPAPAPMVSAAASARLAGKGSASPRTTSTPVASSPSPQPSIVDQRNTRVNACRIASDTSIREDGLEIG